MTVELPTFEIRPYATDIRDFAGTVLVSKLVIISPTPDAKEEYYLFARKGVPNSAIRLRFKIPGDVGAVLDVYASGADAARAEEDVNQVINNLHGLFNPLDDYATSVVLLWEDTRQGG